MSQTIAFAGDIHDNQAFVDHLLHTFQRVKPNAVVLLGDITEPETLEQFEDYNVHLIFGNADFDNIAPLCQQAEQSEMRVHGQSGRHRFGRRILVFRHGVEPRDMSYAMAAHNCDYVIHGHYHAAEHTSVGNGTVLSPGAEGCLLYDVDSDSFEQIEYDDVHNPS
jgi:putative phosphoesterase